MAEQLRVKLAMCHEAFATLHWDFASAIAPDVRHTGSATNWTLNKAREMADRMNAQYGAGTHWVTTQEARDG